MQRNKALQNRVEIEAMYRRVTLQEPVKQLHMKDIRALKLEFILEMCEGDHILQNRLSKTLANLAKARKRKEKTTIEFKLR